MTVSKKNPGQLQLNLIVFLLCLKDFLVLVIGGFSASIANTIFAITILLLVIARFLKKYKYISAYKLVGLCTLSALVIISSIKIESVAGVLPFLLFFILDEGKVDDAIRYMFYSELFLMVLLIPITMAKYFSGYSIYINGGINDFFSKRYRFAFLHPNVLGGYAFNLIILWGWLNYKRIKKIHLLIISLVNIAILVIVGSKTAFFDIFIFVILILLFGNRKKNSKILNCIAGFIFPFLFIFTYFLLKGYLTGNAVSLFFNTLLSNRIHIGAYSLLKYGVSLWGQYIELGIRDHSNKNLIIDSLTFDNLYSYLLINIGIMFAVLISALVFVLVKKGNNKISIFIIVWALYGVSEIQGLYMLRCFPLLLLAFLIRPQKRKLCRIQKISTLRSITT